MYTYVSLSFAMRPSLRAHLTGPEKVSGKRERHKITFKSLRSDLNGDIRVIS